MTTNETASRNEIVKRLSKHDSTVFPTRVVQIMGIKKPVVTPQDLLASPPLTLKDKIRRELQTCIIKAGHHDAGPTATASYTPNGWCLDEEWFNQNWSTLFRNRDGNNQTETIYMVLTTRIYFGTVGTFGTKQLDKHGRLVEYGKQGSGRVVFGMCQMVTSDHCYTESIRKDSTKTYYWQYWMVAMDTDCKIENLFFARTGPLLAVFRGIHAEADQQSALAVQILAIKQYAIDIGLHGEEFGIILDQMWHAGKVYADGRHVPLQRGDSDYYAKANNNDQLLQTRGYKVERATELVVCLKYAGGARGQDVTASAVYKAHKARIATEFQTTGSYVNLCGLRLERFPTFEDMQNQRKHAPEVDDAHTIVIDNITPHILASEIVEELLADPTQNNWRTLPNATMVYCQPRCDYPWARRGARAVIVFRHEVPPEPLDDTKTYTEEQQRQAEAAQSEYQKRTDHHLEINGVIMKYSSTTMGGASSTLTEVDNRTKYVELGKRYSRVQESRPRSSNLASPSASPNRKKLKQQQRTPEKSALALRTTPSTSNFISSRMSPSSEHESSVERYTSGSGEIGEMVALMSNTISKLSADVNTLRLNQEALARSNDTRHAAADSKMQAFEAKVAKTISSNTLKPILRSIRDEVNRIEAAKEEKSIYVAQLSDANVNGTKDRRTELQGRIDITENQIRAHHRMLVRLREDALEQAEQDGIELSDIQLRNDV